MNLFICLRSAGRGLLFATCVLVPLFAGGCRQGTIPARDTPAPQVRSDLNVAQGENPALQKPRPAELPPQVPESAALPDPAGTGSAQRGAGRQILAEGLAMDVSTGSLYIAGTIAIDAHDPDRPVVFLEWLACLPDSREHEAIVLTRVKPSLVHAAALALGWQAGKPGTWDWTGDQIVGHPPEGESVEVRVISEGTSVQGAGAQGAGSEPALLTSWVLNRRTGRTLTQEDASGSFIFAGSRMDRAGRQYDADVSGGLVGLACFGNEVFAYSRLFNPDAGVEEPVWMANPAAVPPVGTKVTLIIRATAKAK